VDGRHRERGKRGVAEATKGANVRAFRKLCESGRLQLKIEPHDAQMSTIKVVDYDPAWPGLFERDKSRILTLIGDMVKGIHHIGSTSVVGLPAKPKIDIDAVLLSETLVPAAVERVKSLAEFTFHGDPYGDGMWTFTSGHGSYGTRLYLCGPGNVTHDNRVLLRDSARTRTPPPHMPH